MRSAGRLSALFLTIFHTFLLMRNRYSRPRVVSRSAQMPRGARAGQLLGLLVFLLSGWLLPHRATAQDTRILGFASATSAVNTETGKVSFGLDEWDLFITSDLTDRISFLGESVFKYDATAGTRFGASVERIIFKYNIKGNHNVVFGKIHTPVNYWNDTYHHGRVFFPTIYRPAVFTEGLIPLHSLGAGLQGQNLTNARFGYDVFVGNGLGSGDATDNDVTKSVTLAAHLKPVDGMRVGGSAYFDRVAPGVAGHSHGTSAPTPLTVPVRQQMYTGSVSYFRPKVEVLIENSYFFNKSRADVGLAMPAANDRTNALYAYAGWRALPKFVLYGRYDRIDHPEARATAEHDHHTTYFTTDALQSIVGGLRYEFSYLAVAKLEFQHDERVPLSGAKRHTNAVTFQFAVGF